MQFNLSSYCLTLSDVHKTRYLDKISLIGVDPYLVNKQSCSKDIKDFPRVVFLDLVSYFVHNISKYTWEEMRAYKALEAYNLAVCGWVKDLCVKAIGDHILILGKVMHSQRMNEKLLSPWVISKSEGKIISAHCDCIAGLGESCTHIAATLFVVEENVKKIEETTPTGVSAYWMPPTNRPAEPSRIQEVDFSTSHKRLDDEPLSYRETTFKNIPPLSEEEKYTLLEQLQNTVQGSVVHAVQRPFSTTLHAGIVNKKRKILMSHYNKIYDKKSLEELRIIGRTINLNISLEDCKLVEKESRDQSRSKCWFAYRAGRVTASKFKSCCRTSLEKPSLSLIKTICYPSVYSFKNKATENGCQHEKAALKDFKKIMTEKHSNFDFEKIGLFINPYYPHFGASPDAIVECDCCGKGLIEIKCPYCARNSGILDQLDNKNFYLSLKNGVVEISEDHAYFFQIQMQLALTATPYCYLVERSEKNFVYKKITRNQKFWENENIKATKFFQNVLLPEILGKYFTRSDLIVTSENETTSEWDELIDLDLCEEVVTTDDYIQPSKKRILTTQTDISIGGCSSDSTPPLYCKCKKEDDKITPMIACESGVCDIEWYHLQCVNLNNIPEDPWICDMCRK